MRVGLTFDLDSASPGCSAGTKAISRSLEELGHEVVLIGSALDLVDKLAAGARFDVIFNGCAPRKTPTHQALIPSLVEAYEMVCTFSSAATIEVCGQLAVMKSLLRDRGIPTGDYWLIETLSDIPRVDAMYPATVGAVVDCSPLQPIVVQDANELSKAGCQVMSQTGTAAIVQPLIQGPRLELALLGSGSHAKVLLPDGLSESLSKGIERSALAAWRTVGGWDAGCIQIQLDADSVPHIARIQAVPGLEPDGAFMRLANSSGLKLIDVISSILQSAAQRTGLASHRPTLRPHMSRSGSTVGSTSQP